MPTVPRSRSSPEEFQVEEVSLFPPSGRGTHTHLWVEKRLRTTDDVLRTLARELDLQQRAVGYAGRKDRLAVTRQWFSVPVTDAERLASLEIAGARVLARERHDERLRVGQLVGNRFRLQVREVDEAAGHAAAETLARLHERGLANRFGPQRFGHDGRNVERGRRILASRYLRGDRRRALLMVSALQSEVFNRVLERRTAALDELLPGDLAIVHATADYLLVTDPAAVADRVAAFEISATGPIFGTKMRRPQGEAAALEDAVMTELDLPAAGRLFLPRGLRLFGDRRPLRVRPKDARAVWRDGVLELRFELPAGSYATVLLEELFPEGFEEGPASPE